MRTFLISSTLLFTATLFCAEKKYAFREIPEELTTAAKAVIRKDEQRLVIRENGAIEHERVYAITILDENAEDLATFYGPYDKYRKLRSVTGRIYGREGEQEEVLRGDDILDFSMIASYSLFEENRIKIIDPEYHEYPYTVEFTSTYLHKSFLDIPDWRVYPDYNVAVQEASFRVVAPGRDSYRYLMRNMDLEAEEEETGDGMVRTWKVEQLPALVAESVSPSLSDVSPVLLVGPNDFNYGGAAGNMSSWEAFGNWIYMLGEDKKELSEAEKEVIHGLVEGIEDPAEKVSVLYKYMQDKVRYVNITLGIGGFEPIAASEVSEAGYGDCKALSNYMRSILEVAGISSWYTLVRAGRSHPGFVAEFPSQQFNHAILAASVPGDTIWLECTSQRLPAGYLGSFTDDRDVLLVNESGGVLSRTPKFGARENTMVMKATCRLDENLDAGISYERSYGGVYFGDMQMRVNNMDAVEQKRHIQNSLSISGFTVDAFVFEERPGKDPEYFEASDISARQLLASEGELLTLEPGILSFRVQMPGRSRNRKYPVYRKRGYRMTDTVYYELPPNLEIQRLPDPVSLDGDFGTYQSAISMDGKRLLYTRQLLVREGEYPAESFRDYYRFMRQVNAADRMKVLLKRL